MTDAPTTPLDTPLPDQPTLVPLPVDVPKRQRTRLAKAELLALLSLHCAVVADDVPQRVADYADPLRALCLRHGLGQADLARVLRALSAELGNGATKRGHHHGTLA